MLRHAHHPVRGPDLDHGCALYIRDRDQEKGVCVERERNKEIHNKRARARERKIWKEKGEKVTKKLEYGKKIRKKNMSMLKPALMAGFDDDPRWLPPEEWPPDNDALDGQPPGGESIPPRRVKSPVSCNGSQRVAVSNCRRIPQTRRGGGKITWRVAGHAQ